MSDSPIGNPSVNPAAATLRFTPAPTVVYCEVEGGAVLLSTSDEVYYGLNQVGSRIWALLAANRDLESLCAALGREYPEVEMVALRADAIALLNDLASSGLLV